MLNGYVSSVSWVGRATLTHSHPLLPCSPHKYIFIADTADATSFRGFNTWQQRVPLACLHACCPAAPAPTPGNMVVLMSLGAAGLWSIRVTNNTQLHHPHQVYPLCHPVLTLGVLRERAEAVAAQLVAVCAGGDVTIFRWDADSPHSNAPRPPDALPNTFLIVTESVVAHRVFVASVHNSQVLHRWLHMCAQFSHVFSVEILPFCFLDDHTHGTLRSSFRVQVFLSDGSSNVIRATFDLSR